MTNEPTPESQQQDVVDKEDQDTRSKLNDNIKTNETAYESAQNHSIENNNNDSIKSSRPGPTQDNDSATAFKKPDPPSDSSMGSHDNVEYAVVDQQDKTKRDSSRQQTDDLSLSPPQQQTQGRNETESVPVDELSISPLRQYPKYWSSEEEEEVFVTNEISTRMKKNKKKRPARKIAIFHNTNNNKGDWNVHDSQVVTQTSSSTKTQEEELCQVLDAEYERALEEREIGYAARYTSVRQTAFVSVTFMILYLTVGTTFFLTQIKELEVQEALLFFMVTITTVGYGNIDKPDTAKFQLFTIVWIFVGIATMTIMVAQCYQWIALEATRAQHARDKAELNKKAYPNNDATTMDPSFELYETRRTCCQQMGDGCQTMWRSCRSWFQYSCLGRTVAVLTPFVGLIGIGATVVGSIEGWTFVQSLYFAVVSLTTVGFGDFVPTKTASIWFCIFWLPFSIGFMSLFLTQIANFYLSLSDKNVRRLEAGMRTKLQREKEALEKERKLAFTRALRFQQANASLEESSSSRGGDGITVVNANGPFTIDDEQEVVQDESDLISMDGSSGVFGTNTREAMGRAYRESIIAKSKYGGPTTTTEKSEEESMSTMKDVIQTVRDNLRAESGTDSLWKASSSRFGTSSVLLRNSIQGSKPHKKPSFALRVLVQERFAEIIAHDVAGFQSRVEIKEDTLSVVMESLRDVAEKWLIPRRARKAFRTVAFSVLYFCGEHGLITRGPQALYDLTPFEFHGLFAQLLAAMGDADTMNGWLVSTQVLAEADLKPPISGEEEMSYAQRLRLSREGGTLT